MSAARAQSAPRVNRTEGFVEANGARLQYLDWGGTGPALIMIHGLGDNPYVFDDVAPAFTDRHRVIAYALRGSGSSDEKGPYDVGTATEDLRGLMDALKIAKADLVGYSAGGNEITEMAARHPDRVGRIIFFDGGYDWADPDFQSVIKALPVAFFDPPAGAMASLDAFRSYQKKTAYPGLDDMRRIDANLRAKVVIQSDGSVKYRTSREVVNALYSALYTNKPRDYAGIRCPTLAIYAEHLYDLSTPSVQQRQGIEAFEQQYWLPYQSKSIDRLRREIANVQIVRVPGAHGSFFMTDHRDVVAAMRRFLAAGSTTLAQNTQH
jgi:pimeloyl-ACP methyl ester carboxylesterase